MTDERRYSEDEVAAIFERATRVEPSSSDAEAIEGPEERTGMTLAEIQRIAGEVGIDPSQIESAARALAHRSTPPEVNRRWFGLPLGVAGTAELPRHLSEEEWAQMVALMRERFSAHGKLDQSGSLRSWRNGNLVIQLEPLGEGQRIRMQTYRRSSAQMIQMGVGMFGTGVVLGALSLLTGEPQAALGSFSLLSLMGAGFVGSQLLTLRGWAGTRARQMAELAERAVELTSRALPGARDRGAIGDGSGSDG